ASSKLSYLAAALAEAPERMSTPDMAEKISASIQTVLLSTSRDVHRAHAALQAVLVAKTALMSRTVVPTSSSVIIEPVINALVRVVDPATMAMFDSDSQQAALFALKSLAKHRYADTIAFARNSVVHAAMAHVRDRNIPVKLAAERCVLYALRLAKVSGEGFDGDEKVLAVYVEDMGGATSDGAKLVLDYHRRVLSKLADTTRELDYLSDDDDDDEKPIAGGIDDEMDDI
ncbi:translational activator of GCN4, partial [Coemansia sp. RSA 2320]